MPSKYYPATRTIVLAPDASLYTRFHELAHRDQHERWALPLIAYAFGHRLRGARWIVTLWVEYDAYRRTRGVMRRLGLWTPAVAAEAKSNLRSYVIAQSVPAIVLPLGSQESTAGHGPSKGFSGMNKHLRNFLAKSPKHCVETALRRKKFRRGKTKPKK